ncbi:MAG: DUF805 domain-containing protein [Pseudomonadota bacterium]
MNLHRMSLQSTSRLHASTQSRSAFDDLSETLFGRVRSGKLSRFDYVFCSLIAVAIYFASIFLMAAAIIVLAMAGRFDALLEAAPLLAPFASLPVLVFVVINISAKRARDAGVPGWPSVLAVLALGLVMPTPGAFLTLNIAFAVVLIALPSASTRGFHY